MERALVQTRKETFHHLAGFELQGAKRLDVLLFNGHGAKVSGRGDGQCRTCAWSTGLRLLQAAFRDLVPGRIVQPFNGSWQRDEGGLR